MEQLEFVAQELACEIHQGKWKNFNAFEQKPLACIAVLSELISRANGHQHKEYVQAITKAIENYHH
jgi:hypothetical protein